MMTGVTARYDPELLRSLPDDLASLLAEATTARQAWFDALDAGSHGAAEKHRFGAIAFKYGLLGGSPNHVPPRF